MAEPVEGAAVRAAEHARHGGTVDWDLGTHLTAFVHPSEALPDEVGHPDGTVGIEHTPVG